MTDSKSLTIYHTNDLHNRLSEQGRRTLTSLYQDTTSSTLLLDAGDAGGSGNVTYNPVGEPILDAMTHIGYTAMTVGNRDFHVTRAGFRAKLFRAGFPILCANIRPARTKPGVRLQSTAEDHPLETSSSQDEPPIRSHLLVKPSDSWTVLIVGLMVPMVTERMWERKLSAYVFDPPLRTARELIPALRQRYSPALTIALTHIGLTNDRALAEEVPGIDLIVGGHSHNVLPEGELVAGRTLIVQAGSHGRHFGIVKVMRTVMPDGSAPISMKATIENL